MFEIKRKNIGSLVTAYPLWDSVWQGADGTDIGGYADWVVADVEEEFGNQGGLQARSSIGTAILLCLFCDAKSPENMNDASYIGRVGGWHGDLFNIDKSRGEGELGSLLYTLVRAPLNFDTARKAEHYAALALQPLLRQGIIKRFDISTEISKQDGMLLLYIRAYDQTSTEVYSSAFTVSSMPKQ